MLDQMSMPVLFAIVIGALTLLIGGLFLVLRVVGGRIRDSDEVPSRSMLRRRRR